VDDDDLVRGTIAMDLQRQGFETVEVGEGRRVTQVLAERPVDALLVDVLMPDMDGIEVITEVRRRWPGLRIVAMSGGGLVDSAHYLHTAAKLGADACLAKPFSGRSLAAAIG
jgi:DNA-binding response OmpR family regulator